MNSKNNELYLREDTYFEPLFNHWYAWPYLIPPATSARHLVNTHKRIMTSFVNNYQLHIMAVNEPSLAGAEFLNCTEEQVGEIRGLINDIDTQCKDLVELSEAIKQLDNMLREHTSGESLEGMYKDVPDALKGYVELVFDMNHNASFRILEGLMYRSQYYKPSLQSVGFGSLNQVKERPFVLSTPRLPDENHLQLNIPFASSDLDTIFKAHQNPVQKSDIDNVFKKYEQVGGLSMADIFTSEKPKYTYNPLHKGVRLQYLGHAGFLIESPKVSILIDPFIASRGAEYAGDIISYSELPAKIDYICLTHNHQDHVSIESLLQLRHKVNKILVPRNNGGSLADPSIKLLLKELNFEVDDVDDLEHMLIPEGKIISIPFLGEHGDLNIRSKTAWFIELQGKKIFMGADSSNLDPYMYRHIEKVTGKVDILAIGMECIGAPYTWLYGALYTKMVSKNIKESRRLNGADCEQAFHMVETFKPDQVFIYALGAEPWYKYFMGLEYSDDSLQIVESKKLIEKCQQIDVPAEALFAKKEVLLD